MCIDGSRQDHPEAAYVVRLTAPWCDEPILLPDFVTGGDFLAEESATHLSPASARAAPQGAAPAGKTHFPQLPLVVIDDL